MADERKAIPLRISKPLWEALNRWAADDLRSLNGQIEFLLREAARKAGRLGDGEERTVVVGDDPTLPKPKPPPPPIPEHPPASV